MFDRITHISDTGGEHGKGEIRADFAISPDLWFFPCHFQGDPVMPGCLGLDALWQLVGFFLGWMGGIGKGRALGVPVYQLFGGKLRDRIPVYWSHCGSYRMRNPDIVGAPAVRSYDDMTRVGEEVKAKGFHGLKTNIAIEVDGRLMAYRPGFVVGKGFPERNWDAFIARSAAKTVEAFRKGCGPDVGIMLDTNFHFRTEGFKRIAEAVGPTKLTWLELDVHDPKAWADQVLCSAPERSAFEKLLAIGSEPMPTTPEQFAALIRSENAKWADVIKRSGAKVD